MPSDSSAFVALPYAPNDALLPFFDARLAAPVSQSQRGFCIFALVLIAAAAVIAVPPALRGYWPFLPIIAGDVAFLLIAMYRHRLGRLSSEHIRVDREGVAIVRRDRHEREVSRRRLPLFGLTLERETDPDYGLRAVHLSLRGKAIEVGRDLAPADKAMFADAF